MSAKLNKHTLKYQLMHQYALELLENDNEVLDLHWWAREQAGDLSPSDCVVLWRQAGAPEVPVCDWSNQWLTIEAYLVDANGNMRLHVGDLLEGWACEHLFDAKMFDLVMKEAEHERTI